MKTIHRSVQFVSGTWFKSCSFLSLFVGVVSFVHTTTIEYQLDPITMMDDARSGKSVCVCVLCCATRNDGGMMYEEMRRSTTLTTHQELTTASRWVVMVFDGMLLSVLSLSWMHTDETKIRLE